VDKPKKLWSDFVMLAGHHQFSLFVLYIAVAAPRSIVMAFDWEPARMILGWASWTVLGASVFGVFYALPYHDKHLCLRDVRALPLLDPQGEIDRRRKHLRRFHQAFDDRRRFLWFTIAALIPTMAIITLKHLLHVGPDRQWDLAAAGLYTAEMPLFVYVIWTQHLHRRLQPWCPFCRRRGKGKNHFEPADPTQPTGQREPRLA